MVAPRQLLRQCCASCMGLAHAGLERVGGRAVRGACHVHVGELGVNLRR